MADSDLSGYVALEGSYFFEKPLLSEQKRHNTSISLQAEYSHKWNDGSSFTFIPFGRLDSSDDERSHFDIRELNNGWFSDNWELRLGLGKVFWGATEFVHLVDIINQTDFIENLDGEDKLGQPMAQLMFPGQWGVIEVFILPYFRERTFPGQNGRLRFTQTVDTDETIYESSKEERHIDFAARYSGTIADTDYGIYYFDGTRREPTLIPGLNANGKAILIPFYELINQSGLDLQQVAGKWLWKLEAIHQSNQRKSFFAGTGGFEYTFVGIVGSQMDLGVIGELVYDERRHDATTPFENDAMLGFRLAINDAASTNLLLGGIQDMDSSTRIIRFEGSSRLGNDWKLNIEGWGFYNVEQEDPLYSLRKDNFIKVDISYYF